MQCILDLLGEYKPLVTVNLPMPPSTNKMYFPVPGGKGKGSRIIRTKEYKSWQCKVEFLEWPESVIIDKVFICMEIQPGPDFCDLGDCDNLLKAPIDALVNNGVIPDDSRRYVTGCLSFFGQSVASGVGRVVLRVFDENVLNGKKKPKTLFDLSEDW